MNAPARLLVAALLGLLCAHAALAQTPAQMIQDAMRPAAMRQAPRKLDVNQPAQVTFETGAVQHMDASADGKWLAYTSVRGGYAELWLRPLDPALPVLPRRLAPALADRLSPALTPDGGMVAFIGAEDDVKGDLYLLDLRQPDAQPRKLTGRDTEDAAPVFSPDGKTLYFQQRSSGEASSHIVALSLASAQAKPQTIDTGGEASSPALSPDGMRLAFVSARGGFPAVYVMSLPGGRLVRLTGGLLPEGSPRFTPDGKSIVYSTVPYALQDQGARADLFTLSVLASAPVEGAGKATALTPARGATLEPTPVPGALLYLSSRGAVANVWSLPPEGEIPSRSAPELLALADELAAQVPVDRPLAALAYGRAAEVSGGSGAVAARALLAQGRQYEALNIAAAARKAYAASAATAHNPEAGLAQIRLVLLDGRAARIGAINDKARAGALSATLAKLETLARFSPDPQVSAQARIEQARLMQERGKDSGSLLEAIRLLDALLAKPGPTPEQVAEALYLKAETYGRIGQGQALLPLYARVISEHPDSPWADQAVARVLDRSQNSVGKKFEDQAQALLLVSEQYRNQLPKLSLGALNRAGDVYYAADEWSKAKDAYRQSLEARQGALAATHTSTQAAAARMALAEILYREERFHQALDLYETEMAGRPYEDRIYRLAKAAHLRKSVAAGDYLLRVGEVPSARAIFAGLLRDDPDFVPAHRGMIRAASVLRTIPATVAEYRGKLAAKPGDATLLYSTGLALTYLDGKAPLMEARDLIRRAILKNGQVEYFHQTLGYIEEVLETVHGERGHLEAALESYQRARFLNQREVNPENAANLDQNVGNIHFLLGQYAQAFEEYRKRLESKVAFDNEETEIVFYQRLGMAAFQARERDMPIEAFKKSLELVERRIQPKYASEVFGRINKQVFDRILTPALGRKDMKDVKDVAERAKALALRQSELNNRLFEASTSPVGPPPDPTWGKYVSTVQGLLSEQERIVGDCAPLVVEDREAMLQTLAVMAGKVREALGFPPRFVQLRAELNDRLGLAYQEAGRWAEARQCFEKALEMNTALGLNRNLAANQRSVAYAAFMEAGLSSGRERERLLDLSEQGFRRVPELVKQYGVTDKRDGGRGKGLINIGLDVAVDKASASQAAYGFSAEQEIRVAEAFLSRIATERGRPVRALGLVERQLETYGGGLGKVEPQDAFGAALLLHRAGLIQAGLAREDEAFARFRRSAELALELRNPLSASLNVADMAALLVRLPVDSKDFAPRLAELRRLEARAGESLRRNPGSPGSLSAPGFHNLMAAQELALADRVANLAGRDAETAALRMDLLRRAGEHLADGLAFFKPVTQPSRRALALQAALRLNQAELSQRLGEDSPRTANLQAALELSTKGLLPSFSWRALAGLGRYPEALAALQALPLDELGCGPGEILGAFAPLVASRLDAGKGEDAYNLLERLGELERVNQMARLGVAAPTDAERALLRRTGLRLLSLRDMEARLAKARDAEKADLSLRLEQEREILRRELGQDRAALPGVARLGASEGEQDWLAMLFGLSAEISATADTLVAVGDSAMAASIRARHVELSARLAALRKEATSTAAKLDAPGALGLFLPLPGEAMDVMESLPKGTSALRLAALPGAEGMRWAGIRLDADSVKSVSLGTGPAPVLPPLAAGERRLLLFEHPGALPAQTWAQASGGALSGSYLARSIKARKPFRRNIAFLSGQMAVPKGFAVVPAQGEATPPVQTLVANPPARLLEQAPTRQDQLPVRFLAIGPDTAAKGAEPQSLASLVPALRDVSLAVLAKAAPADLPLTAQFLSLYGVPSVLASTSPAPALEPFLATYAESSASDARTAPWLLLGDPGLDAKGAAQFATAQFAKYVRTGMEASRAGRHEQALGLLENALRVARSSDQFKKHLPDLLAACRESAYGAGQFDKSLAYAGELAQLLSKAQPDSPAHAEALMRLGLVQARLEQYPQAVKSLEQASEMLANLELAPREIEALTNLGVVLENAVQYDRALAKFQGAMNLTRKSGTKELLARQYMSIGRIHDLRLSQYGQARAAYGEALSLYTALGRKADMAQAQLDIGRTARLMGSFAEADDRYAQALKLVQGDKAQARLRGRIELEQAGNAWQQARFQQAFDLTRGVQKGAEQNGWVQDQVMARNTSGLLWWSLGDHERALRELEAALPLARSLRIRQDEVATTLNNRGLVERDMGQHEKALKTLGEALTIDRAIRSRWAIAYDLRNIAQTYVRMGDAKKALPLLDEAIAIVESTGNRINHAKLLLARGEALLQLGDSDKARASFAQAETLARDMGLRDSLWRALHGQARLDIAAGRREQARALLDKAVETIEGMRAELKVDQLKDGFIADKSVVYEDLVTLLADMGDVAGAFRTAERSRARNLIDLLGNQKRSPRSKEDKALYERIDAVRARLHEQEALLAGAKAQAEREVYERGVKRLQDEYRDTLLDIQAKRPDIASLVSVQPLSLPDVQKLLEPGVGLVAYYVTASEVMAWVVTPQGAELTRTRIGRDTLGKMVLTYRRMLQNLEPADTHSRELNDLLLSPVLPRLAGVKELGIVPHGALHTLSFASLGDGQQYLIDRFPLFQLPSASVFRFTLERRQAGRNTSVLAVGNPDLRDQSLELPFAEREVGAIGWNYPNMTALTRERATKAWITQNIGRFGIIHMAAHGEFDPVNPLFSALKLVGNKKEAEGDLEAAEIFDLKVNADLIVLSACQTGLGKVTSGDEVQGMNQAFLYAGTHALVSSLWRVSDISTAMLMKQFYREYQDRPKAESLRRAMLHVKNRYPHPGYWGAFTLTGDYR